MCARVGRARSGLSRPFCAQNLARRFAGPSPKSMRKRADFAIAQEPGDLRDSHIAFYEISTCEVRPEILEQRRKRKPFDR